MQNLVIVESPTKARTLSKYLGKDYRIEASMGHIRDLPKGKLGVDIEASFAPDYIIPRDKRKRVNELKKLAKEAQNLWLATDPDREGEAIAWHLDHIFKNESKGKSVQRVEFHEITESAIKEAFNHPRSINQPLVDAQQARRILDRLVGYTLSPVLWQKVKRGLSAGRVQSVALRLIVEREREIEKFVPVEYWTIAAELASTTNQKSRFIANLIEHNGQKITISDATQAQQHVTALESADYAVGKVSQKDVRRQPAAPFTTSTLQQTAGNRLGFTAKKTMMVAQNLYEHGVITYMRTDSVNLSTQALDGARDFISTTYGPEYLPKSPRLFKSKVKNAQEAHEAIRPTNLAQTPDSLNNPAFGADHKKLYDLIWKRTLASQMAEALLKQTTVDVTAISSQLSAVSHEVTESSKLKAEGSSYTLRATGSVLVFDGWMKLFPQKQQVEEESEETKEGEMKTEKPQNQLLPQLTDAELLKLLQLNNEQHFTEPSARFTESSLVKKLEELGIGRPSTYAPTISTLIDRFYVEKQEKRFHPTSLGMVVVDFLVLNFPKTFDYSFTASMEESLDEISRGEREWRSTLKEVYSPLQTKIEQVKETATPMKIETEVTDKLCPNCGKPLAVRMSRYGKFLACTGYPDCKYTENLHDKIDIPCPKDGGEIITRKTKTGRIFYGCKNYPNCDWASWTKPGGEKDKKDTTTET